jgi:hypothetical protein
MRDQPSKPNQLGWIEPAYLGIKWPKEQILPSPHEEIGHDTFMNLMFGGGYGLCGINYAQLFIPDPTKVIIDMRCSVEKCHGHDYVQVTLEQAEYTERNIMADCPRCHSRMVFDGRRPGREDGLWEVNFYFFPSYAIACGKRYEAALRWNPKKRQDDPVDFSNVLHKGVAIPRDEHYVNLLRFWHIGCQHKNMQPYWRTMHERHDECPDCDFRAVYDTSG